MKKKGFIEYLLQACVVLVASCFTHNNYVTICVNLTRICDIYFVESRSLCSKFLGPFFKMAVCSTI